MNEINLNNLEYCWTAEVKLNNNTIISIWWTAYYGMKDSIKEVISISSDYPKTKISDLSFLK